jgi:hypothetical protein
VLRDVVLSRLLRLLVQLAVPGHCVLLVNKCPRRRIVYGIRRLWVDGARCLRGDGEKGARLHRCARGLCTHAAIRYSSTLDTPGGGVYAHWATGRGLNRVLGAAQIGSWNTRGRARARCRGHALDSVVIDDRPAKPPTVRRRCVGHCCGCMRGGGHGTGEIDGSRRLGLFFKDLRERACDALRTHSRRGGGAIETESSGSGALYG